MINEIQTSSAPEALGHYAQGTVANGFIFTATQLPIDPQNPDASKPSIEVQTQQALQNIVEIIKSGGGDINTITRITIYVADIDLWDKINEQYVKLMGNSKPARGVIEVQNIRKNYDVAMDAIAVTKT